MQPLEGCLVLDVAQPLYKLHREAIPGENGGRMLAIKGLVQLEENTRGQGREGSLEVKKHSTGFFWKHG